MPLKFSEFAKMTPEERKTLTWKDYPVAYRRMWTIGVPVLAVLILIVTLTPGDPPSQAELAAKAQADSIAKAEAELRSRYPNLPRQSGFDSSVDGVVDYLSTTLNDPKSYEPESWSTLIPSKNGLFQVRHTFRAKNGFGAMVLQNFVFYLDSNSNVIEVKE